MLAATSTKRFHTEDAKITKKNGLALTLIRSGDWKNLRDLCDLRVKKFLHRSANGGRHVHREIPHTEVAKITKKNRIWIEPLPVPAIRKSW